MKNFILSSLLTLLSISTGNAEAPKHHSRGGHHSFADAEKWAKVFDDPSRDSWQKPKEVISALGLGDSDKVADIGAGTGYFIPYLARAVPKGHVYATDVEKTLIDHMKARFKNEKITNATVVLSKFEDAAIPNPVDLVLIVDTYHHIENREAYFKLLKKSLRGKSHVAIIDFKVESKLGPKHKMAQDTVIKEMELAGYSLHKTISFLPEQYFLIFSAKQP